MSSPTSPHLRDLWESRVFPRISANSQGLVSTFSWPLIPWRMCPLHLMLRYQVHSFLWLPKKILFQQIFLKFSYFLKFFRAGWLSLLSFQCTQPPQWSSLSSFSGAPSKFIFFSQMGILLTYKSSMISSSDPSRLLYLFSNKGWSLPKREFSNHVINNII